MSEILNTLEIYFTYPFVTYALIVGVLVSLCSSLFGSTLVLKRFSFIGEGLSNVAFGAMAIATVVGFSNNMLIVLPITVAFAIILLKGGQNSKMSGDATIAMISVGSLALGYLFMSLFTKSANFAGDVCSIMFGSTSILTLSITEVWLSVILSIVVVITFVLLYNRIFAVTFDENFIQATGTNAKFYNLVLAVIIATIIVLAMKLVGSLLISALVIFPAMSSMRVFKSFRSVVISSAVFSVICSTLGILTSILGGTPVGPTIVAIDIVGFIAFYIIGVLKGGIN